jgi:hypothetical protein
MQMSRSAEQSTQLADSLKAWTDAAHWYRHGQGKEEPKQPPASLAILSISAGAAFLRWLAEIDQAARKG